MSYNKARSKRQGHYYKKYDESLDFNFSHSNRKCDKSGCKFVGEYPAPKNYNNLKDYYWFCLEHVREYNLQWNYYGSMSSAQIEHSRKMDYMWERETRPFNSNHFSWSGLASKDPLESIFHTDAVDKNFFGYDKNNKQNMPFSKYSDEYQAMQVLGISYPFTIDALKDRYKRLVKKHHPDLKGGCKVSGDVLKKINISYDILKKMLSTNKV